MQTNFQLVAKFMGSFEQEVLTRPSLRDKDIRELRLNLILEEAQELREALENQDLVEVADALTDILYVVYGTGHAFGINLDKCFEEVHLSNMSKLGSDGKPIKREDGKVLKGPGYFKPNIVKLLV